MTLEEQGCTSMDLNPTFLNLKVARPRTLQNTIRDSTAQALILTLISAKLTMEPKTYTIQPQHATSNTMNPVIEKPRIRIRTRTNKTSNIDPNF